MDQVDQFNIDFKNKETKLLNFLDTFATGKARVNIYVTEEVTQNELKIICSIAEMNKYNIAVCFQSFNIFEDLIKKAKIPYYYSQIIDNWEDLNKVLEKTPESIFIGGILGFDLERVHNFCQEKGVRIRCYPNVCQYRWDNSDGIKTFFIRPEDIAIYDEYIDVLEFFNSKNKQNPLYEIYFHDQKWDGDLREIIQGLKYKVNSYYILGKDFAKFRINCKRKCIKHHNCNLCNSIVEFANTIENSSEYEVFERTHRNG